MRKPIPEYENYSISEYGTVIRNGFELIPFVSKKGYKIVTLSKDNKQRKFYVHYLVWSAFSSVSLRSNQILTFKDKNKLNCNYMNLEPKEIKYSGLRKNL